MKIRTSPWDVAEVLTTPERQAAYLEVVFAEGDMGAFLKALGDVARAKGMARVSKASGLNRESLYKSLRASGKPSFDTVVKVLSSVDIRFAFAPVTTKKKAARSVA